MSQSNKPNWLLITFLTFIFLLLLGISATDYFSHLTTKQRNETIRAAISKDWSIEQIQGLLNSKQ